MLLAMVALSSSAHANTQTPPSPPAEGAPVPAAEQPEVAAEASLSAPEVAPEPEVLDPSTTSKAEASSDLKDEPAPHSEPPTATAEVTADSEDFDLDSNPYNRERPAWAFELAYSPSGLGNGGGLPGATGTETRAVRGLTTQIEWQPPWIQAIGVLGLGASLQYYSELPQGDLIPSGSHLWSAGLQARYQLKFFEGQWVVPMGGYSIERVQYKLDSGTGFFLARGPFAGVMLLLNPFEPSVAGEAYASMGIKRTYLVGELRLREGNSSSGVAIRENAIFAGIRSEW